MGHPYQEELRIALELAHEAGERAKAVQASAGFSYKKDGAGPVSEGDLEANAIICKGLKSAFPDDLLISEEDSSEEGLLPQSHRVWLVDPIDGTADYILGGPDFSIMIGLLVDGEPVLGVIYGPTTQTTWTGIVWSEGEKACHLAEKMQGDVREILLPTQGTSHFPRVAVSKNHSSQFADRLVNLLKPSKVLKKGSLGLKVALIAEGNADLYFAATRRIKVWDTCAPLALLRAAGGNAYTVHGKQLQFGPTLAHRTPFFATSGHFTPQLFKILARPEFDFLKEF